MQQFKLKLLDQVWLHWNEEMNDIMKVVKSNEDAGLLVKSVSEIIKNEAKEQNGGFLIMVLCTLDASLL